MIILCGRNISINVQKTAWDLGEGSLTWEWIDKDGVVGLIDSPEYRRSNPTPRIPTLDDDGLLVHQSNTIVRYIARRYASNLWPIDDDGYVAAERWIEWQATSNSKNMSVVFLDLIRTQREKETT